MRLGTDCGPAVHPVRAVDKSCACHELCAAHISFACASIDALKSKWYQTLASRASCGDKADER